MAASTNMQAGRRPLEQALSTVYELQQFADEVVHALRRATKLPASGSDLRSELADWGIDVPASLRQEEIVWHGGHEDEVDEREQVISLVRPGDIGATQLTVGCIGVGRFKVCLECGWFWCRIVIKGDF